MRPAAGAVFEDCLWLGYGSFLTVPEFMLVPEQQSQTKDPSGGTMSAAGGGVNIDW